MQRRTARVGSCQIETERMGNRVQLPGRTEATSRFREIKDQKRFILALKKPVLIPKSRL